MMKRFLSDFTCVALLIVCLGVEAFSSSEIQIATKFAPIFHQALGSNPRADHITNFDFDGDWRGDNNWANLDDPRFKTKAYIYYSVMETTTHYFIRYSAFHPRDYKGGEVRGRVLSNVLRRTSRAGSRYDPTGLLEQATLAHENDLEGVLIVAAKANEQLADAKIVLAQSLRHNVFINYEPGEDQSAGNVIRVEGDAAVFYIEPMGHGIEAFTGSDAQVAGKEFLIYRHTGNADDAGVVGTGDIGYQLLPANTLLWVRSDPRHRDSKLMCGVFHNYGTIEFKMAGPAGRINTKRVNIGRRGSAFLGTTGGRNMARPPWGWFDNNRRRDPLGRWYFDPASVVKESNGLGDEFSTVYTRTPYWAN